jgi:hypothetical protein
MTFDILRDGDHFLELLSEPARTHTLFHQIITNINIQVHLQDVFFNQLTNDQMYPKIGLIHQTELTDPLPHLHCKSRTKLAEHHERASRNLSLTARGKHITGPAERQA